MAGIQQLIFDLIARDSASPAFQKLAAAAGTAGGKVSELSDKVTKLGDKSASVRLKLDGDAEANAVLDRLDARLLSLAHKGNMHLSIEGAARAAAELAALDLELDKLGKKGGSADKAQGALSGLSGAGGMGALIGAGVALSPVVLTLGTGLAGLAAAAYGTIKPIETAAQKTGGLQANLKNLDPQERAVAASLHVLGLQYDAFQQALKPELLGIFNTGLRIAGNLMHDVQPVAAATGKAFNVFLGQFGATLQDQDWRQFWAFMATTAPQDMAAVGHLFIDLSDDIAIIVPRLQGLAMATLQVSDDFARLLGEGEKVQKSQGNWIEHLPVLGSLFRHMAEDANGTWHTIINLGGSTAKTAATMQDLGRQSDAADLAQAKLAPVTAKNAAAMHDAAMKAQLLAQMTQSAAAQTAALMTAQQNALNVQLGYGTSLVTTANDAAALQAKLKLSGDEVGLQTQKQRDSFAAANTYIADLSNTAVAAFKSGHGVDAAIAAISAGLPVLDSAKTKNRQYWQEVATLVGWLDKLRAERAISEAIHVSGTGVWTVTPGKIGLPGGTAGGPFAAGGRIPGYGGGDRIPVLVEGGETILPKHLTPLIAQFARMHGVPGFASGGVVGSYSGSPAGIGPWADGELSATLHAVAMSTASAMVNAINNAVSGAFPGTAGGPGGGAPAANAALARAMFPQWASGPLWGAWNYVAMAESGWNQFARNPSSGAYGIPQALPPTKMPFAAQAAGGSNPAAQIAWMAGYMSSAYGGPAGAAQHEAAFHWYDQSGWLPTGVSVAVNRTGSAEAVLPAAKLDAMVSLLDEIAGHLNDLKGITASAPATIGAALGAGASPYGVLYP